MKIPKISVKSLKMSYGDYTVMNDVSFDVEEKEVFLIIGPSGCGKSTLLRYLLGLKDVNNGSIFFDKRDINDCIDDKNFYGKKIGVLYQSGALWSSMSLAENVALPLETYTRLPKQDISEIVHLKLALVGLKGFENFYPSQISGGMKKRAGLARAMALDPEILFFDEPSELKDSLGMTLVVVTHELASIFAIGSRAIYLDPNTKTATAVGTPNDLLKSDNENVVHFLSRGKY